jgi:hypothetical protein
MLRSILVAFEKQKNFVKPKYFSNTEKNTLHPDKVTCTTYSE